MIYTYQNCYECPRCATTWEDEWDCQCDDDCPACGMRHISPFESFDLVAPEKAINDRQAEIADLAKQLKELLPGHASNSADMRFNPQK